MTTRTYAFVSLVVNIILVALSLSLSLPFADKTQFFIHLSFISTLEIINAILTNLQKLLKHFNGTARFAFLKISLALFGAGWATVFPNNLALYLKDLKLLVFQY